ncbi:sporulation YhaL family protein [Bacillus sp. M6-12]|uniref:sporulation YhaL family protein n=1 Tax=Bacillus sp. M6-12 TaxID=2054166 RepID=UPI0027E5146F|nr:sporulation YhaL family protein [Bacillus sp. M6-12]
MPIWIWFVVAGIIVSAVMAVRTARLERVQEQEWIEQEGQKYIDRINEDKEKKNQFQPGA